MRHHLAAIGCAAAVLVLGLSACSEEPQLIEGQRMGLTVTRDTNKWEGDPLTYQTNYQRGDKASWERELTQRLQGQNEYIRIGGK